MSATEIVRARIDPDTKARAQAALADMSLSLSDAIRLLLFRVADEKRLPFEIRGSNAETREAIAELEAGKGERFATVEEMMASLRKVNDCALHGVSSRLQAREQRTSSPDPRCRTDSRP